MAARRLEQPWSVEFDVHRWWVDVIVVDRFGVTQRFRIGEVGQGGLGDGVGFAPIDEFSGEPER